MTRFSEIPDPPAPAYQDPAEFGRLWEMVASRPHARVLEIGSLFGGTLHWWSHLPAIELLVSVDMPTDWDQIREGVLEARQQWDGWFSGRVEFQLVDADSTERLTIDTVAIGAPFDFAFIDGDHSYEGVKADWLNYSPLVRSGGLVAFHDTWPNGDVVEPGVVQWVDELRHHCRSIEWTSPTGVGICAFEVP